MKKLYEQYVLPIAIDCVCGMPSFESSRKALMQQATGTVLEIGIGTGRNFAYYNTSKIKAFHGIDPSLHSKALQRAKTAGISVTLNPLSAETLNHADNSFNTVVSTFTLCSIPNLNAALAEIRRVLRPDGQFIFLEHGFAPDANIRHWQNRLTPAWKTIAGGCHLNRDIPALLRAAGFTLTSLTQGYQAGPRVFTHLYSGIASPHKP